VYAASGCSVAESVARIEVAPMTRQRGANLLKGQLFDAKAFGENVPVSPDGRSLR